MKNKYRHPLSVCPSLQAEKQRQNWDSHFAHNPLNPSALLPFAAENHQGGATPAAVREAAEARRLLEAGGNDALPRLRRGERTEARSLMARAARNGAAAALLSPPPSFSSNSTGRL